ncbi:MAG: hypothetical protein IT395_06140 [Candidatus Omnitrophica bacterium]|nr:hypothetical protein [Candidatus Omnitrophota bacterium]
MKKFSLILACLFLTGCATTNMPSYLQPKKPYIKRYYSNYDKTLSSVKSILTELGWGLEEATDPGVYEHTRFNDLDENKLLLVTAVRPTPMLVGTRYARMNIYLRSKKEVSEVEVRYLTTTSTALNNFSTYNNDGAVKRFFARLDEVLPPVEMLSK